MQTEGMSGEIRVHHILPELWVLEARSCAHRWVVFHQSYCFCIIHQAVFPWGTEWLYRHRIHQTDLHQPMMLMQPGELHCNRARTQPGDFIAIEVGESLVKKVAQQLGWPYQDLNLRLEQAGNAHPAMRFALERFRKMLCPTLYASPPAVPRCTCSDRIDQHLENLTEVVSTFIQECAERSRKLITPKHLAAPVRKAIEYLQSHYHQPYSLPQLAKVTGCGKFYLAHLFKQQTGITPTAYRNRILVARTCQALVQFPQKPLECIAGEVGWASPPQEAGKSDKASLMIRHFQRTLKLTPGQFRTSLRQMSPSDRRTFYSNLMRVPKHI